MMLAVAVDDLLLFDFTGFTIVNKFLQSFKMWIYHFIKTKEIQINAQRFFLLNYKTNEKKFNRKVVMDTIRKQYIENGSKKRVKKRKEVLCECCDVNECVTQ